jgi:predicted dehydrogenase
VVDAALAHDLHILSEKPIADTMEACCRIYRKVSAAGKKMAVTMSHRFDQDKQSLEATIKSGDYGPLNYIVHRFTHNCRRFGSWGSSVTRWLTRCWSRGPSTTSTSCGRSPARTPRRSTPRAGTRPGASMPGIAPRS